MVSASGGKPGPAGVPVGPRLAANSLRSACGTGTRIPALVISPKLEQCFSVDHHEYDTTSIIATIEHQYGLAPLGTRDAAVRPIQLFGFGG